MAFLRYNTRQSVPYSSVGLIILLVGVLGISSIGFSQGAVYQDGKLILEEITIRGELRTPQALFLIMKSTPNLSNVLLERSFLEDIVRPVYPGAFGEEPLFGSIQKTPALPFWLRYGSVAVFGGLSIYSYTEGNDEEGFVFGVIAGLDLLGNLIFDLVGD